MMKGWAAGSGGGGGEEEGVFRQVGLVRLCLLLQRGRGGDRERERECK